MGEITHHATHPFEACNFFPSLSLSHTQSSTQVPLSLTQSSTQLPLSLTHTRYITGAIVIFIFKMKFPSKQPMRKLAGMIREYACKTPVPSLQLLTFRRQSLETEQYSFHWEQLAKQLSSLLKCRQRWSDASQARGDRTARWHWQSSSSRCMLGGGNKEHLRELSAAAAAASWHFLVACCTKSSAETQIHG